MSFAAFTTTSATTSSHSSLEEAKRSIKNKSQHLFVDEPTWEHVVYDGKETTLLALFLLKSTQQWILGFVWDVNNPPDPGVMTAYALRTPVS